MMGEFGHHAARGAGVCIDTWGSGPFVIEAGGLTFRFEDSDRFGPSLVNRNGEIRSNPWPSGRSPFWRAHRIWVRQGRRCAEDGVHCLWDEPKPYVFWLDGKIIRVVETGEEDGEQVQVPRPASGDRDRLPSATPSRETNNRKPE